MSPEVSSVLKNFEDHVTLNIQIFIVNFQLTVKVGENSCDLKLFSNLTELEGFKS